MSFLLLTYILNSSLLFFLGLFFLKKYYNLGGVFFLSFCSATALWFIFFFLSYFSTDNLSLILSFGKISYYLSIISLYSFILFLFYFHRRTQNITSIVLILFWVVSCALGYLYIYSPYIISGLHFDSTLNDWYETPGILYNFHVFLSLLFLPLAIGAGVYRFNHVSSIDKKRLQYILLGMLCFIVFCFLFLLILPSFGFRGHMDKYVSFFFIPFIVGVFYSVRRYDFLDIRFTLVNTILFLYSLISSFFVVKILRDYNSRLDNDFRNYWGIKDSSLLLEITIAILVFLFIFNVSRNKLSFFFSHTIFDDALEKMKTQIPFILNINGCNSFLRKNFSENFHIEGAHITSSGKGIYHHIGLFFEKNKQFEFIMNDIVFLEENKDILGQIYHDIGELPLETYIIFPLKDIGLGEIVGFFEIGVKPLNDPFLTSEFESLKSFANFLSSHLKYIDIYSQIQDLTVSLDKKVDEKTIEYNNLLNKQKEFIAYVGHEIKNPITNSLFLTDGLRDSANELGNKEIQEESSLLYDELVKVSKLVKHIFSSEKFDLDKVRLYTSTVDLSQFLHDEVYAFRHKFPNVDFIDELDLSGDWEIDETQFRQVIQNLINNAIKFIDYKTGKIIVSLKKKSKHICITIEDNGEGFNEINISEVFGKYSTGGGNAIGLGMGLYLCKKIVELHGGSICAQKSERLGGACFSIKL